LAYSPHKSYLSNLIGAFPCHGGDSAKSPPRNTNPSATNRAATMKKQAGFIKKFRLFIWRLVGPRDNSVLCRVGRPTRPKPPVEKVPQIAPCAAFLPIVLRNTDICAQFSNDCNTIPHSSRRSRRLSSTRFICLDCCAARFCGCWAADKRYSLDTIRSSSDAYESLTIFENGHGL
jgi:hypothetical protein